MEELQYENNTILFLSQFVNQRSKKGHLFVDLSWYGEAGRFDTTFSCLQCFCFEDLGRRVPEELDFHDAADRFVYV